MFPLGWIFVDVGGHTEVELRLGATCSALHCRWAGREEVWGSSATTGVMITCCQTYVDIKSVPYHV